MIEIMATFGQNKNVLTFEKIEVLNGNQSKYIKPHRIHYTLNGKSLIWDCMKVHDSVSVVIFNKSSKRLVFVRQFRPAVLFAQLCKDIDSIDSNVFSNENIQKVLEKQKNIGFTLELCAGIIDKTGKSPQEIAKEEVEEETGYKVQSDSLKFVSSFRSGVGVSGSLQYLYYCEITDETPKGKGGGIGDEQIEVIESVLPFISVICETNSLFIQRMSIEETKSQLFCDDSEAVMSRPAGLLFGLSWFIFQYLPNL